MCGRYTIFSQIKLQERFDTVNEIDFAPTYNAAPGQALPVVTHHSPNRLQLMRWGLVPSWAKDPQIGYRMINARAETVSEKPAYRSALKHRRCLVPCNGFYEWKRKDGHKQPMFIHLKDQELFALAGLYEHWQDDLGNELLSYTIITTGPNNLMTPIHDRMPVILRKKDEAEWLDEAVEDPLQIERLLVPYSDEEMEAYPVMEAVNNPKNDSPELIVSQRIAP